MKIITIDFETFYSKEFSLSKLTTEEYIRSPFFEVIGSADLDWQPLLQQILMDLSQGKPLAEIALFFHQSLISTIVLMAQQLGHSHIFLSGGCFQNVQLLHNTIVQLRQNQFIPHCPQQIPPNDGGIAFGQAIGAALNLAHSS